MGGTNDLSDEELLAAWMTITDGVTTTHHQLTSELEHLIGAPASSIEVLIRLARSAGLRLPMHSIVAESSMTSGGITKLADRLVDAGLVERQDSDDDRRITMLVLTSDGAAAAEHAARRHLAGLREHVVARITPAQLSAAADLVSTLQQSDDIGRVPETGRRQSQGN